MKTILIIKNPKPGTLSFTFLEINNNSEYCKSDEELDQYLNELYSMMKDSKSKSGIFITNHNLSLPEYAQCLRDFAKVNKVKFIIIK